MSSKIFHFLDSLNLTFQGPDLLGNLGNLGLDLINPLLNSYSISGGKTEGDSSSSYESESTFSSTEETSESSEPVIPVKKPEPVKKPVIAEPVKPAPVVVTQQKPVAQLPANKNANVVIKKGFVLPDHEPTDEELAELSAKLQAVFFFFFAISFPFSFSLLTSKELQGKSSSG